MRRINYNLAAERRIDGRAFALSLSVLVLALVLLNTATLLNLARLQRQNRADQREIASLAQHVAGLEQDRAKQKTKIAAWQKTWRRPLAAANTLIAHKCFSFIARLNFLESICGAGIRVRQLTIVNEPAGKVTMAVSALAQNQLMGLYKKLLPYNLAIARESQSEESYQANLSFRMEDEKK